MIFAVEKNYYKQSLNAQNLFQVYQTKYKRVEQYLQSEIAFVRNKLHKTDDVLELGAGYGRILKELAPNCKSILGIDISEDSVEFGNKYLDGVSNAQLIKMDVHNLQLDSLFEVVLCLQNGLSAMKLDPFKGISAITDLLRPKGKAFISSYSPKFWKHRLDWFYEQADKGLLGEIDEEKTKNGVIVCKDGFRAITQSPEELESIGKASGFPYEVVEVDTSSIFLIITKEQ